MLLKALFILYTYSHRIKNPTSSKVRTCNKQQSFHVAESFVLWKHENQINWNIYNISPIKPSSMCIQSENIFSQSLYNTKKHSLKCILIIKSIFPLKYNPQTSLYIVINIHIWYQYIVFCVMIITIFIRILVGTTKKNHHEAFKLSIPP